MLIPGLFRGSGQAVLARAPGNRPAVAISEEASIKRGMCGQSVEKEGEKEENKERQGQRRAMRRGKEHRRTAGNTKRRVNMRNHRTELRQMRTGRCEGSVGKVASFQSPPFHRGASLGMFSQVSFGVTKHSCRVCSPVFPIRDKNSTSLLPCFC